MAVRAQVLEQLLGVPGWKMSLGERAALEGILAAMRPAVAIEIGTLEGGSLDRVSAHSQHVHAFDLSFHPSVTSTRFPNVVFHEGNSHELLRTTMAELADVGTNVDFVLVDGDHSAEGVRRDLEDLLDSPSVERTVILVHDTLNERVRAGLESVDFARAKVTHVELDFVVGQVWDGGPFENDLWGGLGLVLVGWEVEEGAQEDARRPYDAGEVYSTFRRTLAEGEAAERPAYGEIQALDRQVADLRASIRLMEHSLSWRLTAPLRLLRGLFRR